MSMTMQAAFLTGHGGNEVVCIGERPRPVRGPGEVLVRMRAGTVNRVDLYMRDSGAGITHELPLVQGVEAAGTVAHAPEGSGLRVGQKAVLFSNAFCGRCRYCLQGDQTLCLHADIMGEHRHGTFAEYIAMPAVCFVPLPEKPIVLEPQPRRERERERDRDRRNQGRGEGRRTERTN